MMKLLEWILKGLIVIGILCTMLNCWCAYLTFKIHRLETITLLTKMSDMEGVKGFVKEQNEFLEELGFVYDGEGGLKEDVGE